MATIMTMPEEKHLSLKHYHGFHGFNMGISEKLPIRGHYQERKETQNDWLVELLEKEARGCLLLI